ncbi:MAG: SDR family oxidoreductase [Acidimicrobiales bacterium]
MPRRSSTTTPFSRHRCGPAARAGRSPSGSTSVPRRRWSRRSPRRSALLGKVDAVFANAGVGEGAPFVEQTLELWRRVHSVNIDGAFLTLREGARHMIERGEGGSLVGVSSTSAIHGAPRAQPYAVSKAGMLAMMRGLAVELARYGIRANSIIPGWTETEMTEAGRQNDKFLTNTTQRTPVRRWGTPDDFEAVGAFLADPTQSFLTGDEIVVDGGYTRF